GALAFCLSVCAAQAQTRIEQLTRLKGPEREATLLAGAKAEGALMLYSSMQVPSIAALQKVFEEKYGIKLRFWRGGSEDILRRAMVEKKAGREEVDVFESDGPVLETMHREDLLGKADSPLLDDLIAEARRPHGEWVATRVNIFAAVYNTKLIAKADLPASYDALKDPKWKGKLGIEADDYDWFGSVAHVIGEDRAKSMFGAIAASNGFSLRKGHTLITNLVAAGDVPMGLTVYLQNIDVARKAGAPVEALLLEPIIARPNGIGLSRNPPHPHAALLFYDFVISPEGQRALQTREFIPTSTKIESALSGLKVHFEDPAIQLDEGEKWQKIFRETIGGRGAKR
ncbi:MAG: transporter substrate-binding protein, partial [Hyphomicrobiales bacterium]|nr:transporter substrate-binding protein [Hyphomicrobiales bacterium]